jgi:hypothetical protein
MQLTVWEFIALRPGSYKDMNNLFLFAMLTAKAASRAEGKPREIEELPVEKRDVAYTVRCINAFYGLKDPEEVTECLVANDEDLETDDTAETPPPE